MDRSNQAVCWKDTALNLVLLFMVHWLGMNIAISSEKGSPLPDFMSASGSWECVAGQCLAVVPESHFSTLYFSFPQSTLFWGEKGLLLPLSLSASISQNYVDGGPFPSSKWFFVPTVCTEMKWKLPFESNWSLLLVFLSASISWDYVSGQIQAGEAFPPCWCSSYT